MNHVVLAKAQFQSAGGSNNIWDFIPTIDPAFETLNMNPVIYEDLTIEEVVADPYNEDDKLIPKYNPYSGRGLYEGVNDESAHYHGMSSDSIDGCRTGSVPPIFTGQSTDSFKDDGINVGDRSGIAVPRPRIIHGASNYSFELENFEIRVTKSSMTRYEVGCKDLKYKFQIHTVKMEGGYYWIVRIFEEDHCCIIDELHNCYRQASTWLIGEILSPKLADSGRSLKPKEIMTDMQSLPAYCHQLKCVNHGTVTTIKTNTATKFEYLFIAFSASLEGFHTAIRPAIYIDASHLKGFVQRNLSTSVLISTKQALGWKAIQVSSFSLDTQANGVLLKKYVPKLFFHRSGELKLVSQERTGFHLQASMVVEVGVIPFARNLATTDKFAKPHSRSRKQCFRPQTDLPPPQHRKCKSSGQEGHNIRTCPTRPYRFKQS
ncbi:hypothetical protein Ddye_013853 [Dipteronia dyeriana]|uniref:Uncharacterized protein n=1 Tax=Dipteronia dyeriana TaxID=168575 RepID=A0AAE0CJZ3_9ROSI|nr:hypothetical protein Ddye_013853 [Dipteronia dyeriana]